MDNFTRRSVNLRRLSEWKTVRRAGNRSGLAYCYWAWGLLAREHRDRKTEREKLAAALDIFTKLNMPRERDEVRAKMEKTTGAGTTT